jgi:hypothetical protein
MRYLIALALMTTPALAHPGAGAHLHETDGIWIVAAAFSLGLTLSMLVVARAVRAKR